MLDKETILFVIAGTGTTLAYTLTSVAIGMVLGSLLALMKMSKVKGLSVCAGIYNSIFRGTPLLAQLSIIYFALPHLLSIDIPVFAAGVMAFSLNSAAYVSEIIRSGIQSVDKGQFEAARALGVPYPLMMKDLILPQALRNILPALVNEVVNMLKESALVSTIGGADLMRRASQVAAEHYTYFIPLLIATGCYYILVLIISSLANHLEKRLQYD